MAAPAQNVEAHVRQNAELIKAALADQIITVVQLLKEYPSVRRGTAYRDVLDALIQAHHSQSALEFIDYLDQNNILVRGAWQPYLMAAATGQADVAAALLPRVQTLLRDQLPTLVQAGQLAIVMDYLDQGEATSADLYCLLEAAAAGPYNDIIAYLLLRDPDFGLDRIISSNLIAKAPWAILRMLDRRKDGERWPADVLDELYRNYPTLAAPELVVGLLNRMDLGWAEVPLGYVLAQLSTDRGYWAARHLRTKAPGLPDRRRIEAAWTEALEMALPPNMAKYVMGSL